MLDLSVAFSQQLVKMCEGIMALGLSPCLDFFYLLKSLHESKKDCINSFHNCVYIYTNPTR